MAPVDAFLTTSTPAPQLAKLLRSLFTPEECDQFLRRAKISPEPDARLVELIPPWSASAPQTWFQELAELLERRGISRAPELYQALSREIPAQTPSIATVAQQMHAPIAGRIEKKNPRQTWQARVRSHSLPHWQPRTIQGQEARQRIRRELADQQHEGLRPTVYLLGPLGSGRSRTAFEFATMFHQDYQALIVVEGLAARVVSALPSPLEETHWVLSQIASEAHRWGLVEAPPNEPEAIAAACQALATYLAALEARALVIVDDVLHPGEVAKALPADPCLHVIVSCVQHAPERGLLQLDAFTLDAARDLILLGQDGRRARWSPPQVRAAEQLAWRFDEEPVALAILSRLVRRAEPLTILHELDALEQATRGRRDVSALRPEVVDHVFAPHPDLPDVPTRRTVADLVHMLRVRSGIGPNSATNAHAWDVLRACAWLHPNLPVGQDLLTALTRALTEDATARSGSASQPFLRSYLGDTLEALERTGLVSLPQDNKPAMHALVQNVIRQARGAEAQGDLRLLLGEMARVARAREIGGKAIWTPAQDELDPCLPHLLAGAWALPSLTPGGRVDPEHLELGWRLVRHLRCAGQPWQAVSLGRMVAQRPRSGREVGAWKLGRARLLCELGQTLEHLGTWGPDEDPRAMFVEAERLSGEIAPLALGKTTLARDLHVRTQYLLAEWARKRLSRAPDAPRAPETPLAEALRRLEPLVGAIDAWSDIAWEWRADLRLALAMIWRRAADAPDRLGQGADLTSLACLLKTRALLDEALQIVTSEPRSQSATLEVLLLERAGLAVVLYKQHPEHAPPLAQVLADYDEIGRLRRARLPAVHPALSTLYQNHARALRASRSLDQAEAKARAALSVEEIGAWSGRNYTLALLLLGQILLDEVITTSSPAARKTGALAEDPRLREAQALFERGLHAVERPDGRGRADKVILEFLSKLTQAIQGGLSASPHTDEARQRLDEIASEWGPNSTQLQDQQEMYDRANAPD